MSARAKKPTKEPPALPSRANKVTQRGRPPADDAPTTIYDSPQQRAEPAEPAPRDPPIKAISMKTPGVGNAAPPARAEPRVQPQVRLRAMSEVASSKHAKQQDLGYLAPPRDAAAVRARKMQDYLLWGSVSVIVASVVALIIWFVAR